MNKETGQDAKLKFISRESINEGDELNNFLPTFLISDITNNQDARAKNMIKYCFSEETQGTTSTNSHEVIFI